MKDTIAIDGYEYRRVKAPALETGKWYIHSGEFSVLDLISQIVLKDGKPHRVKSAGRYDDEHEVQLLEFDDVPGTFWYETNMFTLAKAPNTSKKTLRKFEEGKFYRCIAMKRGSNWNRHGDMDAVLDGKPRKCLMRGNDPNHALFDRMKRNSGIGIWEWDLDQFVESSAEEYTEAWAREPKKQAEPRIEKKEDFRRGDPVFVWDDFHDKTTPVSVRYFYKFGSGKTFVFSDGNEGRPGLFYDNVAKFDPAYVGIPLKDLEQKIKRNKAA